MRKVARIFQNGRSQAVRLPASFRFDTALVYIWRDLQTGDVVLSKKPGTWEEFFRMVDAADTPANFMKERDQSLPQERDLF